MCVPGPLEGLVDEGVGDHHALQGVRLVRGAKSVGVVAIGKRPANTLQVGGLDLAQAWHAIKASSGTSFVHETEGQLILNGSYDIAFTMDLALKDLSFAMQLGKEFGVPLDLAGLTTQTFIKGRTAYGGSAQSTQIVKLLEDLLGTALRADGFPARLT